MAPVTDKGGETRSRIVDAARRAFAERGYAGTSMTDLLRAADITKGGFYFHFPSKVDVAVAVVEESQARARDEIDVHITGERAIERLQGLIHGAFVVGCQHQDIGVVKRLCAELAEDPAAAGRVGPPFETWVDISASLLDLAKREGDVSPDLDTAAAARIAVAAYFGLDELLGNDPEAMLAHEEAFIRFVLDAVGARAA